MNINDLVDALGLAPADREWLVPGTVITLTILPDWKIAREIIKPSSEPDVKGNSPRQRQKP